VVGWRASSTCLTNRAWHTGVGFACLRPPAFMPRNAITSRASMVQRFVKPLPAMLNSGRKRYGRAPLQPSCRNADGNRSRPRPDSRIRAYALRGQSGSKGICALAEHWIHIRTTNPIESTFATVRLRHRKTKGSGSRVACLTMLFKLMESASENSSALNRSTLAADANAGVVFADGVPKAAA